MQARRLGIDGLMDRSIATTSSLAAMLRLSTYDAASSLSQWPLDHISRVKCMPVSVVALSVALVTSPCSCACTCTTCACRRTGGPRTGVAAQFKGANPFPSLSPSYPLYGGGGPVLSNSAAAKTCNQSTGPSLVDQKVNPRKGRARDLDPEPRAAERERARLGLGLGLGVGLGFGPFPGR